MEFARDTLGEPLDPWQEWLVIRAGELLPDGTPRFRRVLVIVGRQNGKSHLVMTLALYWLFEECQEQILGLANKLEYAKKLWMRAVKRIRANPELMAFMKPGKRDGIRGGNNDVTIETAEGCEYTVAAANEDAGRSLTINRLLMDEIRSLKNMEAYSAAYFAMNAIDDAQAWFITTEGEEGAVLLDYLRKAATSGEVRDDEEVGEVGAFIWAAPKGSETDDPEALAAANPNWGRRGLRTLLKDARDAKASGGLAEAKFRTDVLCLRVPTLDPAVDPAGWDKGKAEFTPPKDRRVGVIDIPRNMSRATFAVARMTPGGKVQLWAAKEWTGPDALKRMRAELPGVAKTWGIRKLGYMPIGPAAAVLPAMQKSRAIRWPAGLEIEAITAEVPAMCGGFAEQVTAGEIEHLGQELLDVQVKAAGKRWIGKRWEFDWTKDIPLDAAFAAAGAVHLARMLPAPLGPMRLIGPDDD